MSMAKARYVMGQTTVSALQLPTADDDDDTEEENFIDASTTVNTQECTRYLSILYRKYICLS